MAVTGLLDSVEKLKDMLIRLLGVEADDPALVGEGEEEGEVLYGFLTTGARSAQRWLIDQGLDAYWRKRSTALTWSGSEAADGGRYTDLPSDFLRLWGDRTKARSALVEADGDGWGTLIEEEESGLQGDYFYLKNEQLWIARTANPPTTLYLEYYEQHTPLIADATLDFPLDARRLIPCEAADAAKDETWFPGGAGEKAAITDALEKARWEARQVARRTRTPPRMAPPARGANHW